MKKKEIAIKESFDYEDGYYLKIKIEANVSKKNSLNQIQTKIINIFKQINDMNLLLIVTIIKTLLKDDEIKKLVISIAKDDEIISHVSYQDDKLVIYYNKSTTTETEYSITNGIKFKLSSQNDVIEELNNTTFLQDEIKKLHEFEHINPIILTYSDILLVKAYNLFYSETPDFTQKETWIKAQAMGNILKKYSINIDYNIHYTGIDGIPYSFGVEQAAKRLSYHLNYPVVPTWRLELEKKISSIGSVITEYIKQEENPLETLNCISYLFYISYSHEKIKEENRMYSIDKIEKVQRLVQKIDSINIPKIRILN